MVEENEKLTQERAQPDLNLIQEKFGPDIIDALWRRDDYVVKNGVWTPALQEPKKPSDIVGVYRTIFGESPQDPTSRTEKVYIIRNDGTITINFEAVTNEGAKPIPQKSTGIPILMTGRICFINPNQPPVLLVSQIQPNFSSLILTTP